MINKNYYYLFFIFLHNYVLYTDNYPKGKLSNTLISRGLLTPKMLEQLRIEWSMVRKIFCKKKNINF